MLTIPDKLTTPQGNWVYTQPDTGVEFRCLTWQELLGRVKNHREGMHLDLSWGWQLRVEEDMCRSQDALRCEEQVSRLPENADLVSRGRALWAELHGYAQAYPESPTEDDKRVAKEWLEGFRGRVPNFNCACRSDWDRLTNGFQPDLSSREALYRWSVVAHDWVNRRTGKPLFRPDWFQASAAKEI